MNQKNESKFINVVDKDTRHNILTLNQKLKGLKGEIEAKIDDMSLNQEASPEEVTRLSVLLNDVDTAIDGIKSIVDMVITEHGVSEEEFLAINQESIKEIREHFEEKIKDLAKLKEFL